MATPGQPLFVVEDVSHYEFAATVDAAAAMRGLQRGSKARVRVDALGGREFDGTVVELEGGADAITQTRNVRISLPADTALHSGLFGRAIFCCRERKALLVPRSALNERGQIASVFVLNADGIARLRMVTIGRAFGDLVEILTGLSEGDRVAANPQGRALDGKKVSVTP